MEWTIRLEARNGWGEVTTCEIGALHRSLGELADGVGLSLAEAKALLAELQQKIVQSQIDEVRRLRPGLPGLHEAQAAARPAQPHPADVVRHGEGRRLSHPPVRLCRHTRPVRRVVIATVSPSARPLHGRLRRLQADLDSRHSFRKATRLLETFLPCSPSNHASVRNRLHRVASRIEAVEAAALPAPAVPRRRRKARAEIVVMIDGAHLRAVPGHPNRHLDVTAGKVETAGRPLRRFALAPLGAEQPVQAVRASPVSQGWQPGRPVTVYLNGEHLGPAVRRFLIHCQELCTYLANNESALVDYGACYRAGRPISSSRAESSVAEIVNARMARRQRRRWSPQGAHCVAGVRAAVLDDRLHDLTTMPFAA